VGARTAAASLAAASADDMCTPGEAWGAAAAGAPLRRYFPARGGLPPLLATLCDLAGDEARDDLETAPSAGMLSARAALASLALAAQFLREAMLDAATLPLARYELMPEAASGPLGAALRACAAASAAAASPAPGGRAIPSSASLAWAGAGADNGAAAFAAAGDDEGVGKRAAQRLAAAADALSAHGGPEGMRLDGAALEGLEVLENAQGGTAGTLMAARQRGGPESL